MKKRVLILTMILLCAVFFAGCTNEAEEKSTEVAIQFLDAVKDGDFETAASLCTEDAYKESGLGELSNIDQKFCKSLGVKKENLNEKAQASLDSLTQMFHDEFVIDYEIAEVTQSETGVVVKANITYGFDMNELAKVKISNKESDKLTKGYLEKNQEKLLKVYKEKGEKKMMAKIISDLMPKFINKYTEKVSALGDHNDVVQLSIEKQGKKYIIVGMATSGIEEEMTLEVDDKAKSVSENIAKDEAKKEEDKESTDSTETDE